MWEPGAALRAIASGVPPRHGFEPDGEWCEWSRRLKERLAERLGGLEPPRTNLQSRRLEQVQRDGYTRERVEISTYAGVRMPVYVLVPDGGGRRPAVVACHGHGYGSREIVGLEPDGSERTGEPGLHKDFAVELVRRGFTVAAPELLGFGDRRFPEDAAAGPKQSSCFRIAAHLLLLGRTLAGARVFETMRVVDYLLARDEEAASGQASPPVGIMGISGGGLVAAFTAALDERIRASVISGYANTFEDSILHRAHCLDNYIPGILQEAEMPDIIGLIAPRALLVESGEADTVFPAHAAKRAYERLAEIYAAAGAPERLAADFFAGGHEIHGEAAYEWLKRTLEAEA